MRVLATDFGGTRVKWGLFEGGRLLKKGLVSSLEFSDPYKFREHVLTLKWDVLVLGFAGLVKDHTVIHAPNHPNWEGYNLKEVFGDLRFHVENDANLFTLGEAFYGAAKGRKFVLGITLGTGVGGGLVIDGRIVKGYGGLGMEIGHITLDIDGPACNCGSYGCAEAFLGGFYFYEKVQRTFVRYGKSAPTSLKHLEEMARLGVKTAQLLWNDYGRYLGVFVASLINVFDPEIVVLGGGIAKAYDLFKDTMLNEIRRRRVAYVLDTEIAVSSLGEEAALWGGYHLVAGGSQV